MLKQALLLQLFLFSIVSYLHRVQAAPTISSLTELPFNEDNRLEQHIFAYPAGKCASFIDSDKSIHDGKWGKFCFGRLLIIHTASDSTVSDSL